VKLANTNFPNEARIKASYEVVQQLIEASSAQ
jgi:beta-lactamase class C